MVYSAGDASKHHVLHQLFVQLQRREIDRRRHWNAQHLLAMHLLWRVSNNNVVSAFAAAADDDDGDDDDDDDGGGGYVVDDEFTTKMSLMINDHACDQWSCLS